MKKQRQDQRHESFIRQLEKESSHDIKMNIIVRAIQEIISRLEQEKGSFSSTHEERTKARRKYDYWEAIITLVFAGDLR